MGSVYVLVLIAALSSNCSVHVVAENAVDASTASTLIKEGQSAEILCMTKGTGDYFWRKGESLYNSSLVAYFTVGEVSDDSQPYSVTENGTLHIRSVTLKDEGNYFCRVSSAENECYGEVKILVQASLRYFELAIDRCDGDSSCSLYVNPSQFTSFTCTALNAPPLMTLKWFNGAKEITEGIEQNEILPQNGNSREITSTVTAVYGHPASLTCQAVDPKRSNDDVRFAHAQVEMTVPVHESLAIWMSVAGTLAVCLIVYVIFSLIKARANRKQRKNYKKVKGEYVALLEKKEEQIEEISRLKEEQIKEISRLKISMAEKDKALSDLKKEKNDEISRLKGNLTERANEIVKIRKELDKLKDNLRQQEEEVKKERNANVKLQSKLKDKDSELGEISKEFTNLKEDLAKKERAKEQKSSERTSNIKYGKS